MVREKRTVPRYERLTATGAVLLRFAGAEARLKEDDDDSAKQATWFIKADSIGGLTPRPGDLCWGTDGTTRRVKTVGERNEAGEWECVLEREDN
jgi:hypothetical protein